MGALIFAIVTGVAASLLYGELAAWAPRLSAKLVAWAASMAPEDLRERLHEEWSAVVEETPGAMSKLLQALGLCVAGVAISYERRGNALGVRALECALAVCLLVYFAPVFLLVGLTLMGTDGRVWKVDRLAIGDRKPVNVFRFNARKGTMLGGALSRTSLDELPLLFSVARGDLTFVGSVHVFDLANSSKNEIPAILTLRNIKEGPFSEEISNLLKEYQNNRSIKVYIYLLILCAASMFTA